MRPRCEIGVRLLDALVEHDLGAAAQHLEGEAVRERADLRATRAATRGRRGDRASSLARTIEPLGEDVVRAREEHAARARVGDLEAVHHDVERAALERRHEVRPVVLHELGAHAELARDGRGELDLEADQVPGFSGDRRRRTARRPAMSPPQRRTPAARIRSRPLPAGVPGEGHPVVNATSAAIRSASPRRRKRFTLPSLT